MYSPRISQQSLGANDGCLPLLPAVVLEGVACLSIACRQALASESMRRRLASVIRPLCAMWVGVGSAETQTSLRLSSTPSKALRMYSLLIRLSALCGGGDVIGEEVEGSKPRVADQ